MKKAIKIVSVPCRGTTFLNNIKVFYVECKKQFPSPVGELHFSMRYKIHKKSHLIVSVPCRGTTFLNKGTGKFKSWVMITVSVPCRGTTFLNENAEVHQFAAEVGFRPLSGNYISQQPQNLLSRKNMLFPSPVGELHFSIAFLDWINAEFGMRFPSPVGELHFSMMKSRFCVFFQ